MTICEVGLQDCELITAPFSRSCRYHKIQSQKFHGQNLYPSGLCPHLYIAAYPYGLALLYDGRISGQFARVRCPSPTHSVELNIRVRYSWSAVLRYFKRVAIRFLQLIGIDAEYPDKDIVLEITRVHGECPRGLKKDQLFLLNVNNPIELCPASFYASYPGFIKSSIKPEKTTTGKKNTVHCPDPFGVHYETKGDVADCQDFVSAKLEVVNEHGNCPLGHRTGDGFGFEEVIPSGLCVLAFHSVYPYYVTLIHGGVFEWVRHHEFVKVQCPQVKGIIMEVESVRRGASGDGAVKVRVIKTLGGCPKGHKCGDEFVIDSGKQRFCYKALAGLIPFKTLAGKSDEKYSCIGIKDFLTFKVK